MGELKAVKRGRGVVEVWRRCTAEVNVCQRSPKNLLLARTWEIFFLVCFVNANDERGSGLSGAR